jgi:hypothetical protein
VIKRFNKYIKESITAEQYVPIRHDLYNYLAGTMPENRLELDIEDVKMKGILGFFYETLIGKKIRSRYVFKFVDGKIIDGPFEFILKRIGIMKLKSLSLKEIEGIDQSFLYVLQSENGEDYFSYFPMIINFEKLVTIISTPEDPYGEEDWTYEKLQYNEKVNIDAETMTFLKDQGSYYLGMFPRYTDFKEGETVIYWGGNFISKNGESCVIIKKNKETNYSLMFKDGTIHDGCDSERLQKIIDPKKFKKILNLDIDPYDEENWGYQEIEY